MVAAAREGGREPAPLALPPAAAPCCAARAPCRQRAERLACLAPELQVRRLVIFDGICVLCNKFGRYSFYRLVNKDLVSFVPFQDSQHVRCSSAQPPLRR